MNTFLVLAAALCTAAAVAMAWWLGVWGWLHTVNARIAAAELRIDSLERARQSAAGQRGRAVSAQNRDAEAAQLAALEAAVARGKPPALAAAPEPDVIVGDEGNAVADRAFRSPFGRKGA